MKPCVLEHTGQLTTDMQSSGPKVLRANIFLFRVNNTFLPKSDVGGGVAGGVLVEDYSSLNL